MFDYRARFAFLGFAALLAGCAAPPPPPPPPEPVSPVSVFGTPVLIALKVPACVATILIAAPSAALQQLAAPTENGLQPDIRPALDAGIEANCGPPYYVLPR